MGIQSNIWKLQADRFLGDFWIFAPILVPFFKTYGLSATDIFAIEAAYNLIMAISEIPTGYFADVAGRKLSMALGAILRPVAILVYISSGSFWGFVFAECCVGFSASLRSGTDSAMLYDTLLEMGREKEHKKIEGTAHFFTNIGTAVAGIIGGFLSIIWIKLAFIANMFVSLVQVPFVLSLKEPERQVKHVRSLREHYIEVARAIRFTLRHKPVLYASLLFVLVTNVNNVAVWSYYMYFNDLGINIAYYGFLAAMYWVFSGLGARLCYPICKRWGEKTAILLLLLCVPSLLLMAQFKSMWALPLIALNAMQTGLAFPLLRDVIHRNTRSSRRATVISVANMGRRFAYLAFAFTVGFVTDHSDIQHGLVALALLFLLTAIVPAGKLITTERA